MEKMISAKNGMASVLVNGAPLHSCYNPREEARKFVETLPFSGKERVYILIEAGLGYSIPFLRERGAAGALPPPSPAPSAAAAGAADGAAIPGARPFIVSLHASDFFRQKSAEAPDAEWSPNAGSLSLFLETRIPNMEAKYIKIIEWRPARALYGEAYLRLIAETSAFIKRIDASRKAAAFFGRRWFRNTLRNAVLLPEIVIPPKIQSDCFVCASGPSLADALPFLHKMQAKSAPRKAAPLIFAVSSCAAALKAAAVIPDAVITSDGGNWALFHAAQYARAFPARPLAFPLHAALPSNIFNFDTFPFAVNELQAFFLRSAALPVFMLPERGTVSASALDLALGITTGNVYACGMDFAVRGIQTHAKPYVFDTMFYEKSTRFSPWYTQRFERALGTSGGGSLNVYADWFKQYAAQWKGRLFPFSALRLPVNGPAEKPVWPRRRAARAFTKEEYIRALCAHIAANPGGGVHKEIAELLFDDGEVRGIEEIERMIVSLM